MMANLLNKEAILLIRTNILERLAEKWIERLGHTSNRRSILTCCKSSNINHALRGISTASGGV